MNSNSNKYFAFISYKREDEEWAVWFQHEMENYHLPVVLGEREDLPKEFRPVFRDIDELKAGNLPEQIYKALFSSGYLVVICSPNSAKSEWVNKEINDFIKIGNTKGIDNVRNIFPFIVEGHPHANNEAEECFPKALLDLPENKEIVGGNVNEKSGNVREDGRDRAFVKVLAGMLHNVDFDQLWDRYERDRAEALRVELEKRDKLLIAQSRFVAEKAMSIAEEDSYLARLLAVEVLPKDMENPDRPYTVEAERALRKAYSYNSAILRHHSEHVSSVSFSPDGKLIVSAAWDKTIKILNVETGVVIKTLEGDSRCIKSVAFSPDGKRIISASGKSVVSIWDADTYNKTMVLEGHLNRVNSAVYSYDGKCIVTASMDNTVRIWDAATGGQYRVFNGHEDYVYSANFSPNGKQVVSASKDGVILVWDVSTGEIVHKLTGHKEYVSFVSFSPDGKQIASASLDHTVIIWDAITGDKIQTLSGHKKAVSSVSYDSTGRYIVTASWDHTLRVWDLFTGKTIHKLKGHSDNVDYAVFNKNGTRIVSASWDKTVRIWDIGDDVQCNSFDGYKFANFSPDGKYLVTRTDDCAISVYELMTGKIKANWQFDNVSHVSFSPNGLYLVLALSNGMIKIIDAKTGEEIRTLIGHTYSVNSVFFSADGKRIVSASDDMTVIIWDIKSGNPIRVLEKHEKPVKYAVFSNDGKIVASTSGVSILLWNIKTGNKIAVLKGHTRWVNSVVFSPDDKYIYSASGDKTIRVWDLNGNLVRILEGHTDSVNSIGFSFDGRLVISSSRDNTIRVWDVNSGKEIRKWDGQYEDTRTAVFSPNGTYFAYTSNDDYVVFQPFVPLQELINRTQERFKDRLLSLEERKQYYLE
ncbi:MAG: TIR domain-containing protein [Bacteroidales bacterium]|nr:TIR domain-containing protein [Bacteroidales bacterium]